MQRFTRIICLLFFVSWFFVVASIFTYEAKAQSEMESFFIESSYDLLGRKEIEAQLVRADNRVYFYIEKGWWNGHSSREQNDLRIALFELGQEFQDRIYPVLTSTFGVEPRPGIDGDERITILIHQMAGEAGGYFRSNDVYEKAVSPTSNEREMVYLNSEYIGKIEAKSFLAHEFTHLITINQKDLLRRVAEETWLNEARAEYAPTLLGYDDVYEGSNLQRRVRNFLENPTDSLTEWLNTKEDYGVINMFVQYLVDHYGKDVLIDSLKSPQVGIASLDEALRRNGFKEDFAQVFEDWAITVLVNNCEVGSKYCYANPHLASLRVAPVSYYIPGGETVVSTYYTAPAWSANWHRFVGGGQNFTLEFEGTSVVDFEVPYVLCDLHYECSVGFFSLNEEQKGTITFSQFDKTYSSLTIIPFLKSKTSGFSGRENTFLFSWEVKVQREAEAKAQEEVQLRNQLLARVAELQDQIRQLRSQLAALQGQPNPPRAVSCMGFNHNLFFGVRGEEVRCLQEFLKAQGEDVYPEGLVTGNFLALTQQAVIRFQEIYASEILAPLSLNSGTGYVGQMTRNKMNQMIGF
ncbi:MAG TPA: hypothetical protein DIS53_01025 [Candidatus Wildermuthbacteria bacterium]|nr:MAG: Peptidase M6 immune inhibitor A [Parcubacteria group bacterium GW2011_GWB1_49_12]KKW08824.1 MAG: Peptidase M6 immune inhibitor A [Parcubacteria group bacterium GW2011_GWA1_49_26]OHA61750.1 MAG: hypothetical protein A2109_00165 [Candidatus Wildermuthbacteria bacterium GWA1_49_26]OHA65577.1 MAG: hypothetical protein A2674_03080 [Candidatus Wildermuthbacteria bacterium RIFCSPHIGHO2_01_FULL_50_47]OHA69620.1 MAG: hypothetical protein A3D63_03445 [Candidatus Wildermuthbacteria bacterium RIFCS